MRNRIVFFCTMLMVIVQSAQAQIQTNIARIKKELTAATGETRYELLSDLAWEYRFAKADTSIELGKQAFALGKTIGLTSHLARSLNIIGVATNYHGDKVKAYEYYTQALDVAQAQNDSLEIGYSYNNIGRVFHEQGIVEKAYQNILEASEIFWKIKDSTGLAYTYQSLGYLQQTQRNFIEAEKNYHKALAFRIALRHQRNIHIGFYLLGRLYADQDQIDNALQYLLKADSVGRTQEDKIQLAETWIYLSKIYLTKKNIHRADSILNVSLQIIREKNSVRILANALLVGADIAIAQGKPAKAKSLLNQALITAKKIGDVATTKDVYFRLWKFYEMNNDKPAALYHQNQYLIIRDTMKSLDVARKESELEFERQIVTRESENHQLKNRNLLIEQRQKAQALLFGSVFIVILIVAVFMWLYLQKLKAITKQLHKKNEMLLLVNQEKDALISVVAHDLKSPLNKIQGLSNLLKIDGELSDAQRYYIQMMDRVILDGSNFISDLLSVHAFEEERRPEISEFEAAEIINRKVEEFRSLAHDKQITIKSSLKMIKVNSDKEYLARIADNLISNALKFSSPNSEVHITLERKAEEFLFEVQDAGPGFSPQDKKMLFRKFKKLSARPTRGESSNGLGLAIVKTLVDGLSGSIELVSEPEAGAKFIVRLPIDTPDDSVLLDKFLPAELTAIVNE